MTAPGTNRVMRMTVNDDFANVPTAPTSSRTSPTSPASDHPFGGPGAHNGGRVRFNPGDGFLYVTTGDTHNGEVPQSPTLLGGKVLRIDRDGKAAPGNGAPAGFDKRIFTYGHRNVQGITFRPGDDQPIIAEHGPWHSDEITAWCPAATPAGIRARTWPAAATAPTTTAATARTRWKAWTPPSAPPSCR
jgi:aldose sugar dehydrogenase